MPARGASYRIHSAVESESFVNTSKFAGSSAGTWSGHSHSRGMQHSPSLQCCRWALKLATDAVATVLRVDQIIMAKQAGGPKPPAGGGGDED